MNRRSIIAVALLAVAGLAPARAVSPFGAPPLEFRGVIQAGSVVTIGLFDPVSGESFWVPTKGKGSNSRVSVRSYDPVHGRLVVEFDGQTISLTLAKAVILAAPPEPVNLLGADLVAGGGPDRPPATNPVARRQSLRQIEIINQALRQAGEDPLVP